MTRATPMTSASRPLAATTPSPASRSAVEVKVTSADAMQRAGTKRWRQSRRWRCGCGPGLAYRTDPARDVAREKVTRVMGPDKEPRGSRTLHLSRPVYASGLICVRARTSVENQKENQS